MRDGRGAHKYRTNVLLRFAGSMKQLVRVWRLRAMHAPIHPDRPLRPVAWTALRTVLAVVAAMLLILVILPAALAVQAAAI